MGVDDSRQRNAAMGGSDDGRPCPFCRGRGRRRYLDAGDWSHGLTCDECSGTGDFDTMMLVRAYRLGRAHEAASVLARLAGGDAPAELTFDVIRSACVDDVRRQRFEEVLQPNTVENRRLVAELDRLNREREPLLRGLAAMAENLRSEIDREVR